MVEVVGLPARRRQLINLNIDNETYFVLKPTKKIVKTSLIYINNIY